MYVFIYTYMYMVAYDNLCNLRGSHLSNTTPLTHKLFKSGEQCGKLNGTVSSSVARVLQKWQTQCGTISSKMANDVAGPEKCDEDRTVAVFPASQPLSLENATRSETTKQTKQLLSDTCWSRILVVRLPGLGILASC